MRFVKSETINLSYMESLAINSALTMLSNIAETASDPDSQTDARIAAEKIRSLWNKFEFTENLPDDADNFADLMPGLMNTKIYDFFQTKYITGYNEGYEEGRNDGDDEKYNEGYQEGYNEGYDEGYDKGYDEGTEIGRNDGLNEGHSIGYSEGYDEGYADGVEDTQEQNDNTIMAQNP